LDFYPLGAFDLKQGDFEHAPSPLIGVAVNGYTWSNDDDDVADAATDYDEIQGYGADAALRWIGFSVDVAYQTFSAETVDPTVTDGLVLNGDADFDTYMAKGGYMIPLGANFIEPVVGYQVLDADAVADKDERFLAGLNYFFNEHNDKIQLTYERGSDVFATDNASDNDANETAVGDDQDRAFLQFQHLF
jgi:phosphate-selective porin OprO and OprP